MTYWTKQTDQPLFPDIEWNKPERRDQAGRLLIAGGSLHALGAPAESYQIASKEGIGRVIVALPDKTKRLVGPTLPEAAFLPSTPTGEFSREGERELLEYAIHSEGVLLPGDSGRNSQTTILFEQFIKSYGGQITITRDALDIVSGQNDAIFDKPITAIMSFAQLQKIAQLRGMALTYNIDLLKLLDFLHKFTSELPLNLMSLHHGQIIVAGEGRVSTTPLAAGAEPPHWRLATASLAACYQIWNPTKIFEALSQSAFRLRQDLQDAAG